MSRPCVMKGQMRATLPGGRGFRFVSEADPVFIKERDACGDFRTRCHVCGCRRPQGGWDCSGEVKSKCHKHVRADGKTGIWVSEEET